MKILKIEATKEFIHLYTDFDGDVFIRETVPTIGTKLGRTLSTLSCSAKDGVITIKRKENVNDRIYSRYSVFHGGQEVPGVRYITDIAPDVPEDTSEYPQPAIIKTLGAPPMLSKKLNIGQGRIDINLFNIMTTIPGDNTIEYECNGRTYYFRRGPIERIDEYMKTVPIATFIMLNSPTSFGSTGEKALIDACIHPKYVWEPKRDADISAYDMETEEGQGYFCAFVEFLVERYTRPDRKYGHAVGAVIANETNSQYIWSNAGDMPIEEYMKEYTEAMRLAWICSQKHCSHFRTYISLDQHWTDSHMYGLQPLRYYEGRRMLELLNEYATAEGNFGWHLAYHPYPEDLRFPDFWNDRIPYFALSTPRITFKNMEVLEAFLGQEQFLYRGQQRRIIFSEQGFNSHDGPLKNFTEQQGRAGYVLAYMKARNMKTVDMFAHHSCLDNPGEFGLNLGIFRRDFSAPESVGEPKPIFQSFCAMDTEDEAEAVKFAREFIREDMFDFLLNPPPIYMG